MSDLEPEPSVPVTLRYRPVATDLEGTLRSYAGRTSRFVLAPVAVAALAAAAAVGARMPSLWSLASGALAFGLAMIPVAVGARRRVAAWVARSTQGETRIDVDDDGMTWRIADGSWTRLPWRLVLGMRQAPEGIVFVRRGGVVLVLPAAAITEDVRAPLMRIVSRLPPAPSPTEAVRGRRRSPWKMVALWVLLVVMLVALYQLARLR